LGNKKEMINFDSLFRVKTNLRLIAGIVFIVFILFPQMSWFSLFAIIICLHQFTVLFNSIGSAIPVRYLFGAFMCLQILLGPMLAYNGLDSFQVKQYRMQIPEAAYFSYAIPAVIVFILGLHLNAGKLSGEIIEQKGVEELVKQHKSIPYLFIGLGFVSSIIAENFATNLAFIFFLLAGFKFIGAFMIIVGNQKLKIIPLIVVYGSIIVSSLGIGMFQDLLTWIVFLGCVFAVKFNPSINLKIGIAFLFILLSLAIQQLKGNYREATWQRGEDAGFESLNKAYKQTEASNAFFSSNSLATSNLRFNQGYIISYIMKNVPNKVPYANGGELYRILEAAILPRVLAPNKLNAGDRELFMKYSGMRIAKGTSMGLSSVGDGYINFGIIGGCIFMFFLGLLYNHVLKAFYRHSKNFPVLLLFTPLIFYYPIRPDCELQTILGHLVKSCFLIFVLFALWKKYFIVYSPAAEKDTHPHPLVSSSL
jgi:hypothetical protein